MVIASLFSCPASIKQAIIEQNHHCATSRWHTTCHSPFLQLLCVAATFELLCHSHTFTVFGTGVLVLLSRTVHGLSLMSPCTVAAAANGNQFPSFPCVSANQQQKVIMHHRQWASDGNDARSKMSFQFEWSCCGLGCAVPHRD